MKENGYIEVAKARENPPVKIYYELHGDGPQHVVLIMGKLLVCIVLCALWVLMCFSNQIRTELFVPCLGAADKILGRHWQIHCAHL